MGFLDEVKKQQAAENAGTEAQAVQPVDAALPSSTSAVADCLKFLRSDAIAAQNTGPYQRLMFPCPGVFLLVFFKGFH